MDDGLLSEAKQLASKGESMPLLAFLRASTKCNCKCEMCDNWRIKEASVDWLSMKPNIFLQLAEAGCREVRLTGGEPTINPSFFELVQTIQENGMNASVITNGSMLDEELVSSLSDAGLKLVIVSVDSPKQGVHDKIRGFDGIFVRAINGIRNCADEGIPVRVNTVVSNRNYSDLPELVELVASKGASEMSLTPVKDCPNLFLNIKQLEEYNTKIAGMVSSATDETGVFLRAVNSFIFGPPGEDGAVKGDYTGKYYSAHPCLIKGFMPFISHEGSVYLCPNSPYQNYSVGNVVRTPFREVWGSEAAERFREGAQVGCYACNPESVWMNRMLE